MSGVGHVIFPPPVTIAPGAEVDLAAGAEVDLVWHEEP